MKLEKKSWTNFIIQNIIHATIFFPIPRNYFIFNKRNIPWDAQTISENSVHRFIILLLILVLLFLQILLCVLWIGITEEIVRLRANLTNIKSSDSKAPLFIVTVLKMIHLRITLILREPCCNRKSLIPWLKKFYCTYIVGKWNGYRY